MPLVAASETGGAQTQPQYIYVSVSSYIDIGDGGHKTTALVIGRVTKCYVSGIFWKEEPQRVIAPYTKTKHLYGCSS